MAMGKSFGEMNLTPLIDLLLVLGTGCASATAVSRSAAAIASGSKRCVEHREGPITQDQSGERPD